MRTIGLVLAAGASRRMGSPKALLRAADGVPLALKQAAVLRSGGCHAAAVVVGSQAEELRRVLAAEVPLAENPRWAQGRATSLQAGLAAYPEGDGWLFMPVDAVGVASATVQSILHHAQREPDRIWRPFYNGEKGNLLWLPACLKEALLALDADARVDEWAAATGERQLPVEDPAVLRNVNTPEEWRRFCGDSGVD